MEIRPSTAAWLTIGAGVAAYEYACPDGELLSEAVDRGLEGRYKYLVMGGIAVTAAHLLNVFDKLDCNQLDPFTYLSKVRRQKC